MAQQPAKQQRAPYTPRTPDECEAILEAIDEELELREGRIKIATKEHWRLKRFVSRLTGFLWAKQVEQRQDGVCDSPYIEVLERRSTTDLAEQSVDYDRIINDIGRIAKACHNRLQGMNPGSEEEVEVLPVNAGALGEAAKARVAEHDRAVLVARREAKATALKEKAAQWQAALEHAHATLRTAESDKRQAEAMVRAHYGEQAQEHLKWAKLKKDDIKSPFLLPGALSGVPAPNSPEEAQACLTR